MRGRERERVWGMVDAHTLGEASLILSSSPSSLPLVAVIATLHENCTPRPDGIPEEHSLFLNSQHEATGSLPTVAGREGI